MKLLIIEDERGLSDALAHTFRMKGWLTEQAFDGREGLDAAGCGIYDIIILDVMLPSLDGFSVLKSLREENISTPVLMLTAKGDLSSRIRGLNGGADYYLPKPFEMDELVACVNALARRRDTLIDTTPAFGDITLRKEEGRLVSSGGESVRLSAREITLMEMLLSAEGRIVPKDQIYEKLWGFDSSTETSSSEVYISFLRKKLRFIGSSVEIKSSRGIGYSLEKR